MTAKNVGAMMTDDDILRLVAEKLGNPLLFEDLKDDFTIHTEASDWIKFARALLSASKPAAPTDDYAERLELSKALCRIVNNTGMAVWQVEAIERAAKMLSTLPAAPAQSGEPVSKAVQQLKFAVEKLDVAAAHMKLGWTGALDDAHSFVEVALQILETPPQPSPTAVVLDDERAALLSAERAMRDAFYQQLGEIWETALDAKRHIWSLAWGAARAASPQAAVCATCNGHGMIGGPSYYAPDEGGEPCPDCATATQPVQTGESS